MQTKQAANSDSALKSMDYVAWRILNGKRREQEREINRAYSMRPRLRLHTEQ